MGEQANKIGKKIDIGLSNTNSWMTFQAQLDYKDYNTFTFLCDCSNLVMWKMRIAERIKNPAPNQYFKTIEEAVEHYGKSEIKLLDNEYYIDSSDSLDSILNFIYKKIRI